MELVTCPFCVAPWVGTTLVAGRALLPNVSRYMTDVYAVVTISDLMQSTIALAQKVEK